jgi:hypothetical protein
MSSKFSRRYRIQQPPPVCKSKKPYPAPDLTPFLGQLWCSCTWMGICTDGILRMFAGTYKADEDYPSGGLTMNWFIQQDSVDFRARAERDFGESYTFRYTWETFGWAAISEGTVSISEQPPVDSGAKIPNFTIRPGQDSHFRIFSA